MRKTVLKLFIILATHWLYSLSLPAYNLTSPGNLSIQQLDTVDILTNDTTIYNIPEEMPRFPGGDAEIIKFISTAFSNFRYTTDEYIPGEFMVISFIVEKDGTLSRIEMIRNTLPEAFSLELIRIIRSMPKWIPGKNQGVPVRVKYTLPYRLRLNQ